MTPLSDDDARWFSVHVQPHDAALRAWLRGRFRALGDTDDVVQETYSRVLQLRARVSKGVCLLHFRLECGFAANM